jgi:hypothetical protein
MLMFKHRSNVLLAVQVGWDCLVSHFLRIFASRSSPCLHSARFLILTHFMAHLESRRDVADSFVDWEFYPAVLPAVVHLKILITKGENLLQLVLLSVGKFFVSPILSSVLVHPCDVHVQSTHQCFAGLELFGSPCFAISPVIVHPVYTISPCPSSSPSYDADVANSLSQCCP